MYHYAVKIENFSNHDKSNYSRFKHGCKSIAREYGKELAKTFANTEEFGRILLMNKPIVICSAPHHNIPTASFTLKDYFIAGLAPYLLDSEIEIEEAKIHRKHSYNTEYGEMSAEDRFKAISADSFHIDSDFVSGKHVIFVDDCRITGAHEKRIKYMCDKHNLEITSSYVYYASLECESSPSIENEINHFSIKDIDDIIDLMTTGEFVFNTRVVKKILRTSRVDLFKFLSSLVDFNYDWGKHMLDTLVTLAILNGYHKDETMSYNIRTLFATIRSEETIGI